MSHDAPSPVPPSQTCLVCHDAAVTDQELDQLPWRTVAADLLGQQRVAKRRRRRKGKKKVEGRIDIKSSLYLCIPISPQVHPYVSTGASAAPRPQQADHHRCRSSRFRG